MANGDESVWQTLRRLPRWAEWVRFARGGCAPARLGQHLAAVANSARLAGEPAGYVVFGVEDQSLAFLGTKFDPHRGKGRILRRLAADLRPPTRFECEVVRHADRRAVVFRVASAGDRPVTFDNTAFVRVGGSTTTLDRFPHRARTIWTSAHDPSGEVREGATLSDLDPASIREARHRFAARHPAHAEAMAGWDDAAFLRRVFLTRHGAITVAALLLLGRRGCTVLPWPYRECGIDLTVCDSGGRPLRRVHIGPPLLSVGDRLARSIRDDARFVDGLVGRYNEWVLREALLNAITHQDYSWGGRITVTRYSDRVSFSNRARLSPEALARVLSGHAPLSYRNPCLAGAMVELGLIAAVGGGLARMFESHRKLGFALPEFDLSHENEVRLDIPENDLTTPDDSDPSGRTDASRSQSDPAETEDRLPIGTGVLRDHTRRETPEFMQSADTYSYAVGEQTPFEGWSDP